MITVEINDAQIAQAFRQLEAALTDMTQPMRDIGEALVISTKDRMREGNSPDGSPFAPRSATTLRAYEKRKAKHGPKPLWLTGTMREQIAYSAATDQVEITSSAIQSAVMHFGAAQGAFGAWMGKDRLGRTHFHHIPWGNIPARPFLGISEQDRTNIIEIVAEWLESAAKSP
ncbi:phage virion morphogenesis protein [Sinirhodobacter populi]|uniref:Phage virion morphogenesis protein n=1 Tax=Paenirhodobacter populi TaxID=2306993 RepID=A0A443K214_9RHOB|nr:phage virion morphogenesis protein [Sinirhodobacter populi]RWR26796.1 phage virion morphogenesis protein [Sinirhodobacter populi]